MDPYNFTAWLISMGAAAFCFSVLLFFLYRRDLPAAAGKALSMSACTLVLGIPLGLLGAKLFYFLFNASYLLQQGAGTFWTAFRTEELSYYGGAAGVILAAA